MTDDPTLASKRNSAMDDFESVVCLPTFRRPAMLRETLESLAGQAGDVNFAVVVVDNDPGAMEGMAVARGFFESGALAGICVIESQPGNCRACNRAFSEALTRFPNARFILMIDDDEVASPVWLHLMVEAANRSKADIVGGPVSPRFPARVAEGFARHPVYWPAYSRSGVVPMIYGSGNFLIRRDSFRSLQMPGFTLEYNFLGGGDLEFFTRCRRAGFTFYWEHAAQVFETVTDDRAQAPWVLRRGLRIGVINYAVERSFARSLFDWAKLQLKNTALIPVSIGRAVRSFSKGEPGLVCLHPLAVAFGRILGALGFNPEAYRLGRQ